MPTRITQMETPPRERTVFRVEGTLKLDDALVLEKICRDFSQHAAHGITLDLADLTFLDSESASVLCRLKAELGVNLEGLHLSIQRTIQLAERGETAEPNSNL